MKNKICILLTALLILYTASSGCGNQNKTETSVVSVIDTVSVIDEKQSSESERSTEQFSETESRTEQSSETESSTEQSSETEGSTEQSHTESSAVVPEAKSIALTKHEITLTPGQQTEINYLLSPDDAPRKGVTYYISDTSVFTISPYGVITANSPGSAELSAKTDSGLSDVCKITVIPSPEPSLTSTEESPSPSSKLTNAIVDPYTAYNSERVYRDIDLLCSRYPDILAKYDTGKSTKGKPITYVTLGKGSKKGCIVAGIHSREHITISFTMKCIEECAQAYTDGSMYGSYDVRSLLNEYTLYIIPMCNPDGTDISTAGESPLVAVNGFDADNYKLNANGVNLNLNFPYNWETHLANSGYIPGDEQYHGSSVASEKETQAIMKLCSENEFLWLLDMHILGGGIFWRDEYNGEIPDDYKFTSSISDVCGYQIFGISTNISKYSGGLENWFRFAYNRPALCIEMIPISQAYFTDTYIGYNSYFEQAVDWQRTKYTYLEAMSCMK